jgi:hypothetical protein
MNNNIDKYQLYCDLDGVIVDFEGGIIKTGNQLVRMVDYQEFHEPINATDYENKYEYEFYKLIKKLYDQDGSLKNQYTFKDFTGGNKAFRNLMYWYISKNKQWWIELDWAPTGEELWSYISPLSPKILTSPVGPISAEGKRVWCKHNLGLSGGDVIVVDNKAINTGDKIGILIDDREKSMAQIKSVGGIGILHTTGDFNSTKTELNRILGV